VIVGKPELMAQHPAEAGLDTEKARSALMEMPWVIELTYAEHLPWLRAQGIDPDLLNKTVLPSNSLVLAACLAGAGVSAQSRAVVERDLQDGSLVALSQEPDQPDLGYYIAFRPGPMKKDVRVFLRWMRSVA
jgi:LysR family glycine cleavage system transcriptional activator